MKFALHSVLTLAGLGVGCANDTPSPNGNSTADSGSATSEDSGAGAGDSGSQVQTFSEFDVRACRAQSDGSVTLYAEHDSEPEGCAFVTLEESTADRLFDVDVDEGWQVRSASVVGDGCPTEIPGDPSGRARVVSARGRIDLNLTTDGFPTGVDEASVVLEVEMAAQNPFGDAELSVAASGLVVRVCPESSDGG